MYQPDTTCAMRDSHFLKDSMPGVGWAAGLELPPYTFFVYIVVK
jgi:hypothetical protein